MRKSLFILILTILVVIFLADPIKQVIFIPGHKVRLGGKANRQTITAGFYQPLSLFPW